MGPQYNTEVLIQTIKRACSVPTSQLTYTDADFCALATDQLQTSVVPLVMSTREEYFVDYINVAAPADGFIPMPRRAVGAKLRSVCFVQQENPLVLVNLPRIDLDVVAGVGFFNYATLAGFYIQGNNIVLYPNTSVPVNSSIRLYFYSRVFSLADPDNYGQVRSVDEMSNTVVLTRVPFDWEVGTVINSINSLPNFQASNDEMTITAISSPSVVFDNVGGVEVNDYLSLYGYSAIPQVPIEAHNYLAQLTAVKALEGLGDQAGMAAAIADAEKLKQSLLVMISQRVDGSVKKVMSPDGGLRMWSGIGRWGRGWGW